MAASLMVTRWCFSYSDLTPCRMSIVSSMVGWSTKTGWKRRSRAASFSMYLRYSLSVVAPMHWISPRASRLEDAGGVDCAFGGARADQGMELVDEEHNLAAGANLIEDLLQPLLELAPVLCTGYQWAHVERKHALVHERLGDVTKRDQLSQALGDRSLADTCLADQGWVVLGPAAENLDHALDLGLAADHRVERVLAG